MVKRASLFLAVVFAALALSSSGHAQSPPPVLGQPGERPGALPDAAPELAGAAPPSAAPPAVGPGGIAVPAPPTEEAPAAPTGVPRVHHAPISVVHEHEPIVLHAEIDHPELVHGVTLVFRNARGILGAVPFLRGSDGYVATIPAEEVAAPSLGYDIELERIDGAHLVVFATRAAPQIVQVIEDHMDAHERALYQRLGGKRSVASLSTEYVRFGTTTGTTSLACPAGLAGCPAGTMRVPSTDDQYYRVEGSYTYRPFRTVAEFSIRLGIVRGTALDPTTLDSSKYSVGLNYGAPSVVFRLADAWHLEAEVLTSITEVGFSVGTGNALTIGDLYGSNLTLGWEVIGFTPETYFGSRFYSKMNIVAARRVKIAPGIEITDMPHAGTYGVRLLGDAGFDLGKGFLLTLRTGYQARTSTSGGPTFGAGLNLAF
jgi:hypothetical protein